jgi:hypothetical protein
VARSVQGYQFTFARTLEGLVGAGVRVYRTFEAARERAL